MPLKVDFQIESKKSGGQFKDPVVRLEAGEPIAKLEMGDKLYMIFPKGNWSHQNPSLNGLQQCVVGELSVNRRRYMTLLINPYN